VINHVVTVSSFLCVAAVSVRGSPAEALAKLGAPHQNKPTVALASTFHAGDGTTILQIDAPLCTDASSHATSYWPAQHRDRFREPDKAMLVDLAVLHPDRAELAIGERTAIE
jgi:hypothetical protein